MRIFSNDRLTGLQRLSQGIEALRSLLMRADSGDPGEAGDDNSGERTLTPWRIFSDLDSLWSGLRSPSSCVGCFWASSALGSRRSADHGGEPPVSLAVAACWRSWSAHPQLPVGRGDVAVREGGASTRSCVAPRVGAGP